MDMSAFRFQGTFRTYQARVLDSVHTYLDDGRCHIVAPPGSGKTILGLELATRFQSPAIVFSPTRAIRTQWIDRFDQHFRNDSGESPLQACTTDFDDLSAQTLLISTTYQGLFTAWSQEDSGAQLLARVRKAGIATIILDEAHHLQNKWQRVLEDFVEQLRKTMPDLHIIALTATPPLDTSRNEWERYISLCGPIDEEIYVPELVKAGDLCPHMDMLAIDMPNEPEMQAINKVYQRAYAMLDDLVKSTFYPAFIDFMNTMARDDDCLDTVLSNEETLPGLLKLSSTLSEIDLGDFGGRNHSDSHRLGSSSNVATPVLHPDNFQLLHEFAGPIEPSANWTTGIEAILKFGEDWQPWFPYEATQIVENTVTKHNLRHHSRWLKPFDEDISKILAHSTVKLELVRRILLSETTNDPATTRILVLSDYIYADDLQLIDGRDDASKKTIADTKMTRIGIVPLFEVIRTLVVAKSPMTLAVVTGSLVIFDAHTLAQAQAMTDQHINATSLVGDYFTVSSSADLLHIATALFENGDIQILLGTASLLGEGWDSPAVNTLVLASAVGSFMLSNQMRGRALRKDPNNPDKVSLIWHIAAYNPLSVTEPSNSIETWIEANRPSTAWDPATNPDLETLHRRFQSFVGLHLDDCIAPEYAPYDCEISSGIERIVDMNRPLEKTIEQYSVGSEASGLRLGTKRLRDNVAMAWKKALEKTGTDSGGPQMRLSLNIERRPRPFMRWFILRAIIIAMLLGLTATILQGLSNYARMGMNFSFKLIIFTILVGICAYGLQVWLFRLIINEEKHLRRLGEATIHTAERLGLLHSFDLQPVIYRDPLSWKVMLNAGSLAEKKLFTDCMSQMNSPLRAPRYVLVHPKRFSWLPIERAMAVPDVFATRREDVDIFIEELRRSGIRLSPVYLRNDEGRILLRNLRKRNGKNIYAALTKRRRIWS